MLPRHACSSLTQLKHCIDSDLLFITLHTAHNVTRPPLAGIIAMNWMCLISGSISCLFSATLWIASPLGSTVFGPLLYFVFFLFISLSRFRFQLNVMEMACYRLQNVEWVPRRHSSLATTWHVHACITLCDSSARINITFLCSHYTPKCVNAQTFNFVFLLHVDVVMSC